LDANLNPKTGKDNAALWGARAHDWGEVQEPTMEPVFQEVLDKLAAGPGIRHLDIGCGAGMAALLANARGSEVVGLDASEALLDFARARAPGVAFHAGDMEELPFDDCSFHTISAINALQYAGNPPVALREAARLLRPDGRIAIVTWADTEKMEAARFNACLRPLLPPPPKDAPHPFNLSGEKALRDFALGAGLEPLESGEVEAPWIYKDRTTALRGVLSAGVVVRAMQILGEDVVREAYSKALEQFRQPGGGYRIGATFRYLLAAA